MNLGETQGYDGNCCYTDGRVKEPIKNKKRQKMTVGTEFLTPYQLHKRWAGAISPKTLANWRAKNQGPKWQKVGGRVVYPLGAVLEYEKAGISPG